jgi:glyoxylase-like metal-dependent hydrolase (beta-lactamase superfamily II)
VAVLQPVADGVWITTSDLYQTNTGVVAGRGGCLLVDPGVLPGELGALAGALAGQQLAVLAGVATHPHWDHVLWSAALGPAPRYGTAEAAALLAAERAELVDGPLEQLHAEYYIRFERELAGRLTPLAEPAVPWAGPPVRLVPAGGHTPGHAAVWVEAAGVLFAGDMLSDVEVPLPDPGLPDPFGSYRAGLDALAAVPRVRVVVPGHGRAGDRGALRARLDADRRYLDGVEAVVRRMVAAGADEEAVVAAAMAVPDPRIDGRPPMRAAHAGNVRGLYRELRGTSV